MRTLTRTLCMLMATMHCGATTLWATGKAEARARAIIESTGFRDGLIVEIDCDGGELTAALGNATNSMVQGLDTDYGQVQQTRQAVRKRGLGGRVSARFFDGRKLPYADNLVVAGTPDVGKRHKDKYLLRFTNASESLAAFEGKKGVQLKILSKQDGKDLFTMDMDSLPVFDGMSAANGKLYVSLQDGSVLCLSDR